MDWLSGIPPDKEGRDTILVFIDALTGMLHFQACKKTDTSKDTARHFVHNVGRLHGMPEVVVSDRDIRLRANFWRALQARLGVDLRFTTRHNPNANGKVERINLVLATSRFVGPFKVLEPPHNHRPANPNCVYLETPTSLKIHMPVNIKSVKRYHTRPARLGGPVNVIPEPLVVQGVDLWEVDEILAERLSTPKGRRKTAKPEHQVLVKWTGFHLLDATWEPLQNMAQ